MNELLAQSINLLGAMLLMLAFAMISQRRIVSLINLFTLQGLALVLSTAMLGTLPVTGRKKRLRRRRRESPQGHTLNVDALAVNHFYLRDNGFEDNGSLLAVIYKQISTP